MICHVEQFLSEIPPKAGADFGMGQIQSMAFGRVKVFCDKGSSWNEERMVAIHMRKKWGNPPSYFC
jgi:hypothetical protein